MIVVLAIVGSGLGALARYEVAGAVQRRVASTRPWGTATVNLLGAVALGLLVGWQAANRLDANAVTVLGTGVLGGFTTFSTWMVESVRLGQEGAAAGLVAAAINLAGLLLLGVAVAAAAMAVA